MNFLKIPNFFCSTSSVKDDVMSIKHLLLQHQKLVITSVDEKDVQRIHIRRSNVFEDTFRHISKSSFDVQR